MKLSKPKADIFIPDSIPVEKALARTTHVAIGAHQDDLEFFAYHGIIECYGRNDRWFTGITCTDGAGSSRTGIYADLTDEEMAKVRVHEQRKAAFVGEYSAMFQLGYSSAEIRNNADTTIVDEIYQILEASAPKVVYLHNPADKHDTHIATFWRSLQALRRLPKKKRPLKVYGCEVWRDLDWMSDDAKVALSNSGREHLQAALNGIFDSQIAGGKRYDLAVMGRRHANATYFDAHSSDAETGLTFAMDLTPLVNDPLMDVSDYVLGYIDQFRADVANRVGKFKP